MAFFFFFPTSTLHCFPPAWVELEHMALWEVVSYNYVASHPEYFWLSRSDLLPLSLRGAYIH